jgi:antiviral defense system Shedu protein SduA
MPKINQRKRSGKRPAYVVVTNRFYGNKLKGVRIYFEGKRPTNLQKDGMIGFGKHILELLTDKYDRFRWIITESTDSISTKRHIVRVRTSQQTLSRLNKRLYGVSADLKNDLVASSFASLFPTEFRKTDSPTYLPGKLASILTKDVISRLSVEDKDALRLILPDFISSESIASVNLLKAEAQIQSLRELAADLERALSENKSEAWWQIYIRSKILIIQQGYIKALDQINVAVVETKYPDFSLLTHDSYLDILEIKKPSTPLLKKDESRGNFYWDTEISKAIIQVENYIENVSKHGDHITVHLQKRHKIDMQVLRPRGIIIAGNRNTLVDQKEKDDFRLLSQSLKNITVLTYDELLTRLRNYIEVLEGFRNPTNIEPTQ